jgi:hypothetical protein
MADTAFMIMPFGDAISNIAYNRIIKPTLTDLGFDVYRADEIFSVNPIYDDIFTAIEQASLVIVDISGRNPNCFYELGISHTLKHSRTIMVTHDGFEDVPFDISHFRILNYEDTIEGSEELQINLRRTVESITKGLLGFYRNEFEIVTKIFEGGGNRSDLLILIGIDKSDKPIEMDSPIRVEGHIGTESFAMTASEAKYQMAPFEKLGYIHVLDNRLVVTPKGKQFVNHLIATGYALDFFNRKKYADGYVSFLEKMKTKKEDQQ